MEPNVPSPKQFYFLIVGVVFFHITYLIALRYGYGIHIDVTLKNWDETTSRDVRDYITTSLHLVPETFCQNDSLLVIMVYSSPDHFEQRRAIRNTWAQKKILKKWNMEAYFMLGQTRNLSVQRLVAGESMHYNDIVQEDFFDSYSNLTLKSVSMLKVFNSRKHCRYLLKADEDVLINIRRFRNFLKYRTSKYNLLTGRLIVKEKVNRRFRYRWYSPRYMYMETYYPNFIAGPAYLMSRDVAEKLYKSALELPVFHLEDVFITGLCALHAGVKPTSNAFFVDYLPPTSLYYVMYSIHGVDPLILRSLKCRYDPLRCPKAQKPKNRLKNLSKAFRNL